MLTGENPYYCFLCIERGARDAAPCVRAPLGVHPVYHTCLIQFLNELASTKLSAISDPALGLALSSFLFRHRSRRVETKTL